MSPEMQAIKTIFESTDYLKPLMQYMDLNKNEANFHLIDLDKLSSSERAAIAWAKAIWSGEVDKNMIDLMSGFGLLDRKAKIAIVVALDLVHPYSSPDDEMAKFPTLQIIQKAKKGEPLDDKIVLN